MLNINANVNHNVFQQGVSGLQNSSRSIVESANQLVRSGTVERASTTTTDIVEPLVNLRQQQQIFDASANVVKIADENLGALIDIQS